MHTGESSRSLPIGIRGLAMTIGLLLLSNLGVPMSSAGGLTPSAPKITAKSDYWGIWANATQPASSPNALSYEYSVNGGRKWSASTIPFVYYEGKRGVTYTLMVRAKNTAGVSAATSARVRQRALAPCTSDQISCPRIPLPTSFIRVKKTMTMTLSNSIKLPTFSNVEVHYEPSGACDISASGVVTGITEGTCEIYVYGYGNRVTTEGFASDNATVFVRPRGSAVGSNQLLANDFACSRPVQTIGAKPRAPFIQVMATGRTTVTLHIGPPTNAVAGQAICYDYTLNGGALWKYATDGHASGTFVVTGLSGNKTYVFKARAITPGGLGITSATVAARTK